MSLPAALTVASHQGQTGQQCVVYPTVKNKKSLSFFFFFLFSPAQTVTCSDKQKTHRPLQSAVLRSAAAAQLTRNTK